MTTIAMLRDEADTKLVVKTSGCKGRLESRPYIGLGKSEVVRNALELLSAHGAGIAAKPPAETMARLIGCWDSGGQRLSERTGERFARLLQEAKHAHRTGR